MVACMKMIACTTPNDFLSYKLLNEDELINCTKSTLVKMNNNYLYKDVTCPDPSIDFFLLLFCNYFKNIINCASSRMQKYYISLLKNTLQRFVILPTKTDNTRKTTMGYKTTRIIVQSINKNSAKTVKNGNIELFLEFIDDCVSFIEDEHGEIEFLEANFKKYVNNREGPCDVIDYSKFLATNALLNESVIKNNKDKFTRLMEFYLGRLIVGFEPRTLDTEYTDSIYKIFQ